MHSGRQVGRRVCGYRYVSIVRAYTCAERVGNVGVDLRDLYAMVSQQIHAWAVVIRIIFFLSEYYYYYFYLILSFRSLQYVHCRQYQSNNCNNNIMPQTNTQYKHARLLSYRQGTILDISRGPKGHRAEWVRCIYMTYVQLYGIYL